jgi:hypothetical protein
MNAAAEIDELSTDRGALRKHNIIEFSRMKREPVLEWIGRHLGDNPRELTLLAKSECPAVRAAVAANKNTPFTVMIALAHDPDATVRTRLAKNLGCPTRILSILSYDKNAGVSKQAQYTSWRLRMNVDV